MRLRSHNFFTRSCQTFYEFNASSLFSFIVKFEGLFPAENTSDDFDSRVMEILTKLNREKKLRKKLGAKSSEITLEISMDGIRLINYKELNVDIEIPLSQIEHIINLPRKRQYFGIIGHMNKTIALSPLSPKQEANWNFEQRNLSAFIMIKCMESDVNQMNFAFSRAFELAYKEKIKKEQTFTLEDSQKQVVDLKRRLDDVSALLDPIRLRDYLFAKKLNYLSEIKF